MLRRTFLQFFASLFALFGISAAEAKTHLSTKINVLVDGKVVGTINKLNVSETRDFVTRLPNYSITANDIRFDKMRIKEAFSRGHCHVLAQRKPWQVEIHEFKPGGKVVTHVQNAWVAKIGESGLYDKGIDIGDSILVHDVKMVCEDIWPDLNE